MSDALYPTRLRWHHTVGVARHDGVAVELRRCPALPCLDTVTELDYIPGVIAQVRRGCGATEELQAGEQRALLWLLQEMARHARGIVG